MRDVICSNRMVCVVTCGGRKKLLKLLRDTTLVICSNEPRKTDDERFCNNAFC